MSDLLFRDLPYMKRATATVIARTPEGGIILDRTLFYPTGGGQPGDNGVLSWDNTRIVIATTLQGPQGETVLVPAEPRPLPAIGQEVAQSLDWDRRYVHMRMHSALHLLCVAVPYAVTGGAIGVTRSRLDFDMPDAPPNREAIEELLNFWVAMDAPISEQWISQADLDANPGLVKTLSVKPPRGAERIRLIQIGEKPDIIDLQPCGGTHVASTGEIGAIRLGKIENKGRQNRRVYLTLDKSRA
ncbi:MAG: alanyl-tRNA editing protein [Pseudomonadota bacterium]